jgi:hypothetical protein
MAYHLAGEGQQARDIALEAGVLPPGIQGESLAGKRVVVCFDGGRVRTRTRGRGRRRSNGYRGYRRPWRAPRLLVIYTLDPKGRKRRRELPLYDGVLTCAEALFRLLTSYLVALGITQATQVIFVADGAPEHWQGVAALRAVLELDPARVVEVLDWAHAIQHLTKVADAYSSWSEKRRTRWLKTQRKYLKQGQIKAVLQALNVLCRGRQKKTLCREIAFFEQHAHRMRYGAFRKNAIPLGSGAVESALRRIVNLRMKGPGIFWIPEHAQKMLFLRCQLLSGRWDAFIRALLCPQQAINVASQNQTVALQTRKAA